MHATAFIDRRQLGAHFRQKNTIGLLHSFDQAQGFVGKRQGAVGLSLTQLQFRLPHLIQRLFENGAGVGIEQGGGLGNVMGMPKIFQQMVDLPKGGGICWGCMCCVLMIVRIRAGVCRSVLRGIRCRCRLWPALGFFTQKLPIAQPQNTLIDTNRIGALHKYG